MAYVPQFIQTDSSVLQGTLNQYQQAYDTETNRQNQANDTYSAVPTGQIDAVDKNQVMDRFSKERDALDKKYNYDRANSQYAKELASKITELRSDPLWGHLQQKDELNKMRQNLIANKGADYHENFDPNSITLKDRNKFQEWKPTDLKDVREAAALWGKEVAQNIVKPQTISRPVPGIVQFDNYTGFSNINEAADYLNTKGADMLKQSIVSRGFDPKDPKIYQEAYTAALSNLVGDVKTTQQRDLQWELAQEERIAKAKAAGANQGNAWVKRTNIGVNSPSPVEGGLPELESINKKIADIDATPNKTQEQIAQRDILQRQVDYAMNEYMNVANTPKGQKAIESGMLIINEKVSSPLINKQQLFREFENYFVQTNAASRSKAGAEGVGILNGIINDFSPWFNKEVKDGQEILKPKDLKSISEEITKKLVDQNTDPKVISYINKEVYNTAKEWKKYYNGEGNYSDVAYKDNIERPVNEKLKEGKLMVADVYDPPYDIGTTDYKKAVDTVVRNMAVNAFDVEMENKKGKLIPVSESDSKSIYARLMKNQSDLKIHSAMERESEPRIIITEPDGNKVVLKMNVAKMGKDTAYELARETGLPQFKDVFYKNINLEPGNYSLEDTKDKTLTNIISNKYGDIKPFKGLEVTKVGDTQYTIKSDAITNNGYPNGYTVYSKTDMMETLDDIYSDYKQGK